MQAYTVTTGLNKFFLVYPTPGWCFNIEKRQIARYEYTNITSNDKYGREQRVSVQEFVAYRIQ
jgi:hypothetical protein